MKRTRKSHRYGDPPEVHRQAAEDDAREIKRILPHLRKAIQTGDCPHAARLMRSVAHTSGSLVVERRGDSKSRLGRIGKNLAEGKIFQKFVQACVLPDRTRIIMKSRKRRK